MLAPREHLYYKINIFFFIELRLQLGQHLRISEAGYRIYFDNTFYDFWYIKILFNLMPGWHTFMGEDILVSLTNGF